MKKNLIIRNISLGLLLAAALTGSARAQSADALIDKLVDKGILTVKEANELREEADKNFTQAYSVKSGMPDWVTALKFNGDVRLRYENFNSDGSYVAGTATNAFASRNRYRFRLRFGATVSLLDNLEAGFRLSSSEPGKGDSSFGGDPISANTTFANNASKKFIYIDQAYAKWYAMNGPTLSLSFTGGKMENPFLFDDMVFDPDYTPEGFALQSTLRLNGHHSLKFNGGAFALQEFGLSSHDPLLYGAQLRWDATWSKKLATTFGVAGLIINNSQLLANSVVPNQNAGNTRLDTLLTRGVPAYNYNPFIVDGAVTYTLDSFPLYRGAFPIKFGGEYMQNPAAESSLADNFAWNLGVTFGKSGKKGTWDISYVYKWLGADAWWEELVDSDFGGLWYMSPPGGGSGYQSGTNVKGHVMRLAYSPTDSLTLSVKYFLTDLINPYPASVKSSSMNRLQVDASLKF